MNFRRLILSLSLAFVLSDAGFPTMAQDWDSALDRYEAICGECIQMRGIVESGGRISKRRLANLVEELSLLKKMLADKSDSMSASQRERFESIKSRYTGGEENGRPVVKIAEEAIAEPAGERPVSTPRQNSRPAEVPGKHSAAAPCVDTSLSVHGIERGGMIEPMCSIPSQMAECRLEYASPTLEGVSFIPQESPASVRRFDKFALVHCGLWPDLSYGAMFSIVHSQSGWGGYLSARSNFRNVSSEFEFSSADVGGTQSFSGAVRRARSNISIGAMYMPCRWLGVYAGGGYGLFSYFWETADSKWAKIYDCCYSGISLDCGLVFSFGIFSAGVGVSTTAFKYSDMSVSLGVRF